MAALGTIGDFRQRDERTYIRRGVWEIKVSLSRPNTVKFNTYNPSKSSAPAEETAFQTRTCLLCGPRSTCGSDSEEQRSRKGRWMRSVLLLCMRNFPVVSLSRSVCSVSGEQRLSARHVKSQNEDKWTPPKPPTSNNLRY